MPNEKILLVDDEQDLLELVRYNPTKEGCQVKCAAYGEEAPETPRLESLNVILLDLMLPGAGTGHTIRTLINQRDKNG